MNMMDKLNKTFRAMPLYESDGYKIGHKAMLAANTSREYFTWIPRSLKHMHASIDKIMSGGQQLAVRYVHSHFKEDFFDQPVEVALKFVKDMCAYLMMDYNGDHFVALHKLGYLPMRFQSLPEGILTKKNIPHFTGINTVDGYAWLGLFLETLISKLLWQLPTTATIGYQFKKNSLEWVKKTDSDNLWLADYMNHDFHSRGGNPYTSVAVGLGHAFSNKGSDTLNVIPASRYYYDVGDDEVCINSVNASEHSVTCTGIFYYVNLLKKGVLTHKIKEYYAFDLPCEGHVGAPDWLAIAEWLNLSDWIKKFPKGILSVVGDTFNVWKLITHIIARLKKEIMAREGKLVVRGDSGDPTDIICGKKAWATVDAGTFERKWNEATGETDSIKISVEEGKGIVELLYDIFGGDKSKEGYIRLDSHVGSIYGDQINLERQIQMYERLAAKKFAATNVILGVGSYTYVMLTRDSAGYAAKGAWFEILELGDEDDEQSFRLGFNIYKDPITDDGTKKSLKGFQLVYLDEEHGEYEVRGEVSEELAFSDLNLLKTIYCDGKFYNQVTLDEIRARLVA